MQPSPAELAFELRRIQEYIWVRYVKHRSAPESLDEARALAVLEEHYAGRRMEADAECFYYGILAFERSFAEPARERELLERALAAFQSYRRQTSSGFRWEAVDDRYEQTVARLAQTARAAD